MYCIICGRELKKSNGPIGPVCAKKNNRQLKVTSARNSRKQELKYIEKKHDIFAGELCG